MTPDTPNPFVYDTLNAEVAAKHLEAHVKLLGELASYGSNLLVRCFGDRSNKLEDIIILSCLFRQHLVHLDAIYVLLSRGCVYASYIHLRAMIEEQISLQWMLKSDTAYRAKCLYVWNLRKRKRINKRTDSTTPEGIGFAAKIKQYSDTVAALQTDAMASEANKQNADIDAILKDTELAKIDRQFEALRNPTKGPKRDFDKEWFTPAGISSIAKMARDVDLEPLYYIFYDRYSEVMHSSGFFEHLHVDEDGASIEQIRSPEDFDGVLKMAYNCAFAFHRLIIERYRPGEDVNFSLKYMQEWRDRAMQVPKIEINRGSK
jgi:hypothetical protein